MKIRTVFMAKIASKRKETRPLLSGKPTWRAKKLIIFYLKNEVLSQSLRPAQSARLSRHFSKACSKANSRAHFSHPGAKKNIKNEKNERNIAANRSLIFHDFFVVKSEYNNNNNN